MKLKLSDYNKSVTYFAKIYKHMTWLSYEFEFGCFARWFILEEFIRLIFFSFPNRI